MPQYSQVSKFQRYLRENRNRVIYLKDLYLLNKHCAPLKSLWTKIIVEESWKGSRKKMLLSFRGCKKLNLRYKAVRLWMTTSKRYRYLKTCANTPICLEPKDRLGEMRAPLLQLLYYLYLLIYLRRMLVKIEPSSLWSWIVSHRQRSYRIGVIRVIWQTLVRINQGNTIETDY